MLTSFLLALKCTPDAVGRKASGLLGLFRSFFSQIRHYGVVNRRSYNPSMLQSFDDMRRIDFIALFCLFKFGITYSLLEHKRNLPVEVYVLIRTNKFTN